MDELDESCVVLGAGAAVSGSLNLDGTEIFWNAELSSSFRKRKRLQRRVRQRNIDATLLIPQVRL